MRNELGRFIKGSKAPKTAFKKGIIPWNKGKTGFKGFWTGKKMSEEHKENLRKSHIGQTAWNKGKDYPQISKENHHNWKGGKNINSDGYIFIHSPNHPYKSKRNYVREHRLVMEKHLGRYLEPKEVVHHNGTKYPMNSIENRGDNRIENLVLFPNKSSHLKFHRDFTSNK